MYNSQTTPWHLNQTTLQGLVDNFLTTPYSDKLINEVKTSSKDGIITAKYKVPGYEKDEIKIDLKPSATFDDKTLIVTATNQEYGTTTFRSYIPKNIEEKLTKANLKNGILTITFLQEKTKPALANLKIEVD